MDLEDLEDLVDAEDDLEAAFRELEAQQGLDRVRAQAGEPDPLAAMKARLDRELHAGPFVVLFCTACKAKNRASLRRIRAKVPVCGRCRTPLAK